MGIPSIKLSRRLRSKAKIRMFHIACATSFSKSLFLMKSSKFIISNSFGV